MIIFIIVGMPAAGKDIARDYAERNSFPYFASGDIVRDTVKSRGLEPNPENMARVSTELRGADGLGVTRQVLAAALDSGSGTVFMEGMRSWQEIELVRREARCCVIAFVAPRSLRRERIVSRGRPDDSPSAFNQRDLREIDYGTAVPIAMADEYVLNTSAMEDALGDLDAIVKKRSR